MSKVQLAGNANGTGIFTIASPNSNTDRTLTLPDNTGTILTSASTGISASNITTGTLPLAQGGTGTTTGMALVPLQTVALSGLSTFGFSVSAYPQYAVYINNLGGSVANAIVRLRASTNGGSSFVSNFNFRTTIDGVNGATDVYNSNAGTSSGGYVWYDIWNGAAPSGTNGVVMIAGTSYYASNKRLTFSAYMAGQTQSGQNIQMSIGQTQDDSNQYNYVMFELSSGTFYGNSTALICGVKAV